jgi:tetratricopeptide (TPR) repeat protein
MADRYLYAPSAGFAWLLAAGIARLADGAGGGARGRIVHAGALAACVALFAARTAQYLPVWRDSEALWSRVVEVSRSSLGRNALAAVRIRQGRFDEAEALLRGSASVPDADTHRMLGVLLDKQGRYREALSAYERGLAVCARGGCSAEMLGTLHFNRGVTYWHLGDYRSSARAYEEAHRAAPDFAAASQWAEKARRLAR